MFSYAGCERRLGFMKSEPQAGTNGAIGPLEVFKQECEERVAGYASDALLKESGRNFLTQTLRAKYSYNFRWMGRPIIQYPQDIVALQEIIWQVQPDCIIETGIAHGGSIIFFASMLELLGNNGVVIALDIDIRKHNRTEIERHPMSKRITMIEGSSVDPTIARRVAMLASKQSRILVVLDSDHTHGHVLAELCLYAPLVSVGSYCVVFDGVIEDMAKGFYSDRNWGPGNNPKTAVNEFLKSNSQFVIDRELENKLVVTAAPSGYLRRIK
jgi:cephalosporin hydroxylase